MIRAEAILEATAILKVANSGVRYSDPTGEIYEITGNLTAKQITEIEAKADEVLIEWAAQKYARDRALAYDSIGNQLDMLMKDMKNNTTTHQESCEAVKAQFPKPE